MAHAYLVCRHCTFFFYQDELKPISQTQSKANAYQICWTVNKNDMFQRHGVHSAPNLTNQPGIAGHQHLVHWNEGEVFTALLADAFTGTVLPLPIPGSA